MKERLEGLLKLLTDTRASLLNDYLIALAQQPWDNANSMKAVDTAGRLHDIDRHITNIQMEIKRIAPEVPHAS